jgi:hypothetical protein
MELAACAVSYLGADVLQRLFSVKAIAWHAHGRTDRFGGSTRLKRLFLCGCRWCRPGWRNFGERRRLKDALTALPARVTADARDPEFLEES